MNYLDYKKLEKQVIESGNVDAICYLMDTGGSYVSSRLQSFKYTHSDLDDDERKQLLRLNNLDEHDVLIGGEVHRIVGDIERKELVLKKVDEIELFTILHQIHWIKTKGVKNAIYKTNS
jgi:hypothetical protein